MICRESVFESELYPVLLQNLSDETVLFFDIETTGLSAATSYVYLIGCAFFTDRKEAPKSMKLVQWMTTDASEEKELISRFFSFCKDYTRLIHYNGTGFDLPFLEKKAKRHCLTLPDVFSSGLDLISHAKHFAKKNPLSDCKLKTVERYFGLPRTDCFSGADLIAVYSSFTGLHRLNQLNGSKIEEEQALEHVLLLHNAEDVSSLPSLMLLTALSDAEGLHSFLTGYTQKENLKIKEARPDSITFLLPLSFSFPKGWHMTLWESNDIASFEVILQESELCLRIPVFHGELKHFYTNYRDYYYLPAEDCAMHKSVASFVDKDHRIKATPATCYTRQSGRFLLCLMLSPKKSAAQKTDTEENFPVCFASEYESPQQFTPFTEESLADSEKMFRLLLRLIISFMNC